MLAEKLADKKVAVMEPAGRKLMEWGFTPNQFTFMGIWFSACCLISLMLGEMILGVVFLVFAGVCDLCDGAVARSSATRSIVGEFLDSSADRLSDVLILLGLMAYSYDTWGKFAAFMASGIMGLTLLISYQKSLGGKLGVGNVGGLMERAERFLATGTILVVPASVGLVLLVVFLLSLVLTNFQRFWIVFSRLRRLERSGVSTQ